MASGEPIVIADWKGGVNAEAGPYLLNDTQCKDARNVHSTPIGSFRKRNGFTTFNDGTLNSVTDLDTTHSLFACNTSTKSLIAVGTDNDAATDTIAKVTTGGVCSVLATGKTPGLRWEWVQAPTSGGQGPIYGVNGTDTAQQWDGTAGTTSAWTASTGTVPLAKYLLYHADRIWATGIALEQGRVRYSGLTASAVPAPDPRNWDSDNYVDIEPQDGEDITGLQDVGPYILVTKPRRTYVITDPVSGAWKQISNSVGCISHRSMAQSPVGTFFLSEDAGVCVTDGDSVDTNIGQAIMPFIRQAREDNPTKMPFCAGFVWENSYYLSIPYGATTNDITLEYQFDTQAWWVHNGGAASNQFALLDPVGTPKLYSAYATSGRIYRAFVPDSFVDNAVAYTSYLTTGYYPWAQPHLNKRVTQFRVDGRGGAPWTVTAATSFSDTYNALESLAWEGTDAGGTFGDTEGDGTIYGPSPDDGTDFGPTPAVTAFRFYTPVEGWGRAWSLKFSDASTVDWEVFSLTSFLRARSD